MSRLSNMYDTLRNMVTGLGMQGIDSSVATQYILNLIDRNSLENMYRGDWLARKIVDAPADDMTREWRAWQASQPQIEALEEIEKTIDLQRKIKQWISRARLYGGSALILGVDDGNDASQPLNLEKCGKDCLKYVVVLNCWELNAGERIYNVMDPYFSRASYYTIATPVSGIEQPKRGSNVVPLVKAGRPVVMPYSMSQIHPSRVIELPGNELPDWRLATLGGGWGDSVLQTVVDTMQGFTTTLQSIAAMVSDGKLDVVKIPDMALNLTTPGYKDKLVERFALSTQTKSVISALLLDKEEEWDRVNTQYSGLPMILHEFLTVISGAADIPVSRLFGQASGRGLDGGSTASSGESDLRNYYDNCSSKQKNDITPRISVLDDVLKLTALGKIDPNIHYEWNPLWMMSDGEKSKIALAKAQATQVYATIGIINSDALREGLVNQLIEDGTYPGFDDAVEEFGSEPEMDDETGGYIQPSGMPALNPARMAIEEQKTRAIESKSKAATDDARPFLDYDPNQPRAASAPGHSSGEFASYAGGVESITPGETEQQREQRGSARLVQLHQQWAYLGRQLFQYTDQSPNDRVVRKLVSEQIRIINSIHATRIIQNGGEGTDKKGVLRDVVVIGGGPAGMQAGLSGGTEGLNTLVVEGSPKAGGQAGSSSRIENVLGFPIGLSGEKLATDGVQQVKRLGGEVQTNKQATGISYDKETGIKTVTFADGSSVQSRAVVIAGGIQFRHVNIPGSDSPDVVYGSSGALKARVKDGDGIIVGGANSAGQAAMDAAISSRHVTLMARGGLDNMSSYLKEQITSHPRITVMKGEITEIQKDANGRMTGAKLKDGTVLPAKGVLYAIGSIPKTDWAANIERDENGSIKVGGPGRAELETNIPGVFAAGDVRSGPLAMKRVITAASDGAMAISMAHGYIDKMPGRKKTVTDIKDAKFKVKPGKDAATVWLNKIHRYDTDEQTYTGYPAPGDEDLFD